MSYKVINGKLIRTRPSTGKVKQQSVPPTPSTIPNMTTKGKYLGLCNRSACLKPGPTWWNIGSEAYYCGRCAEMINVDGCQRYGEPNLCHKVTGWAPDSYTPLFDTTSRKNYRE